MSDPREILGTSLTDVRVRPCGEIVELGFKDESGSPITLALPHQALGMLLMTLPRLIDMSLRQRTGDATLRHVYLVGDWRVETASDGESLLLSLATPDGFAVSFCLPFDDARALGQSLAGFVPALTPAMPIRH
jgi:hypothetical protein